jgi:hypothetical protein
VITAAEARIRMGTALRTLDVANHRGRGPECPHRPDLGAGAERVPMPAIWRDRDGVCRETTTCAILCPLCAALFWATRGRW